MDTANSVVDRNISITTNSLKGTEKFEFWREHVCGVLTGADVAAWEGEPFNISANDMVDGSISLLSIDNSACIVDWEPDRSNVQDLDNLILSFSRNGHLRVIPDDSDVSVHSGQCVAVRDDRPYSITVREPYQLYTVKLPRKTLVTQNLDWLTGRQLNEVHGVGEIMAGFASNLCENAQVLNPYLIKKLTSTLADMLSIIHETFNENQPSGTSSARQDVTVQRPKAFINLHLPDRQLSPAMVAQHVNLSLRYLNMLFEAEQKTVSRFIWDQRLDRAATGLASQRLRIFQVKMIASMHGFKSESHFAVAFRERFKLTPNDYCLQATRTQPDHPDFHNGC